MTLYKGLPIILFSVLFGIIACSTNQSSKESNVQPLNLSLFVTQEYMVLGAWGGFMPNVYFTIGEKIKLGAENPTEFWAIQKESETDPGRTIWAVYANDSAYLDSSNNFLALPNEHVQDIVPPETLNKPAAGTIVHTLAENSARILTSEDVEKSIIRPLLAHDIMAKDLFVIHKRMKNVPDADQITLVLDTMFTVNNMISLRPLAQAIKAAGYSHITLKYFEGGDAVLREVRSVNEIKHALITPSDSLLPKLYSILGI